MFSCFLVLGLRVLAKRNFLRLAIFFSQQFFCDLKLFLYVELNCSLYVELNCSSYVELKVFYSTLQRVLLNSVSRSFYFAYLLREKSRDFCIESINAYSVKSSVILYSALCSRTSLYPVSRVYTTLSTLDSALLFNSEIPLRILILWLWAPCLTF